MTQITKKASNRWYWTSVLSALVGILLSLYLLVQHTRLKAGIQGGPSLCTLGANFNCEAVASSHFSEILGIPLAGVGAVYFVFCLFLLLTVSPGKKRWGILGSILVLTALAAMAVDFVLFGIQVFSIRSFCLFCIFTYVVNLVMLISAVQSNLPEGRVNWAKIRQSLNFTSQGGELSIPSVVIVLIGVLCVCTLVALVPSFVRTQAPTQEKIEDALAQFYANWKKLPVRALDFKEGDGSIGNPASKVRVVMFSDFECPHCRKAAFTVTSALHPLKDTVFLVFKHYPLDAS